MAERSNGLLEYIPGARPFFQQNSNGQPLEGFAENIRVSIREYVESAQNEIEKGHNFLQWVLTRVFEATEDDATDAIIDGPNDLGIDAYLPVDFSEGKIYLFQSKYGSSHSIEAITKFKEDVKRLPSKDISKMRPELAYLVTQILEKNLKIECVYVTDQKVENDDYDSIEVYDIDVIIQKLWDRIKKPAAGKKASIRLECKLRYQNTLLGILKLRELTNFVTKNRDYVFESNIRQWMQFKTTVNKGLRETLQELPHKFFYYNNGITIVVSDFEELEDSSIMLYSPQIVNGAQTSNSVLDHAKRTHNLDGSITVTIIKAADELDQNNITKYRNSQNAVRGKDLVSLMDFHKSIKSQMENLHYFYEIQGGSFDSKTKSQQSEFVGEQLYNRYLPDNHKKAIVAKDAIQAFVAGIEQRPTEAYSSPAQFLPRGSKYDEVFNEKLKDDYRLLLYPYLVKEYAKIVLNYGKKGGHKTKRYATLFFVAVYFKILHEKILLTHDDFKEDISKLEPIFKSIKLNQRILKLTDTVVTKFLEDTVVDDEMLAANTYHNFFSHHVWQDSMIRVIEKKIKHEEDEIDSIQTLVQDLF
ncbi:MAG: abortive phage infection protein [Thaumarchaeota archaeon 13_1_40CM_38_12]|nr:MAG: abortive phage infection protein [Thaumarchaeota archaeon 13_1_40CM_38_12]OLC33959.1 MAG: abortive phage infection protein [Thaumarchaeota archaeon 13_1_40CM_4_38_7]OLC93603.1 MAG: abortive phage infection protein [Thaumarchaeota archaeon 13_1_40CM_3_38_6]OLD28217.1 MAG: abortive phage infection protein [Thaumarchaeota archaeon 13_1_40CM_2_39_7]TLY03298.1 MAG: AIPR family protein [Nitrososphaerota archaeon]